MHIINTDLWHLAGLVALGLTFYVYKVLTRPINRIPGDWHTKWTDWIPRIQGFKAATIRHIDSLHKKHGAIVRTGVNEVDISDVNAVKIIYSSRETYVKDAAFYSALTDRKRPSLFSSTDVELHRLQRRLLGGSMSESSLKEYESFVHDKVQSVIEQMRKEMKARGCVDIHKWWMFLTTDVIGELSFGESFNMIESGQKNQYSHDLEQLASIGALTTTFPKLFKTLAQIPYISIPYVTHASLLRTRLRDYAAQSVARHRRIVAADPENARPTLLSKLFLAEETRDDKHGIIIGDEDLITNAQSYIQAGTDTTANTLTYLVWEVCRHPEIHARLLSELRALSSAEDEDGPSDEQLRHLPYLTNLIDETLRLHPAISAPLPRVVPPGGVTFNGHYLPAGTIVTAQWYSLARNPNIYTDPETFDPTRWENPTKTMKDAFMAFGGGARTCVGMHLARLELRIATALFFLTFPETEISSLEGMSDKDMDMVLHFLTSPAGKRCLVNVK